MGSSYASGELKHRREYQEGAGGDPCYPGSPCQLRTRSEILDICGMTKVLASQETTVCL